MTDLEIDNAVEIVDFKRGLSDSQKTKIKPVATVPSESIEAAAIAFKSCDQRGGEGSHAFLLDPKPCTVYEHKDFDG